MASRRKSSIPCMIRPSEIMDHGDLDEMEVSVSSVLENGSSQISTDISSNKELPSSQEEEEEAKEQEKPKTETPRPQRKPQGGYECKYCPFITQNLNEFKEHVDSNHPNVILNPLYLCVVCNFNTKKFDILTEHNEKCHPGETNFRFKRIKLNNQTVLEQTIEGVNRSVLYDTTDGDNREKLASFHFNKSTNVKIVKPKVDTKRFFRKGDEAENHLDSLTVDFTNKQLTALNMNGTVIIPEAALKDGFSHIMPSLQRPPNFNLVPKIAVPLNTTKYNSSLDGNMTLITSFNKFPYPTQAELSWLTAASKHPEEQIRVWFTTQRLKQGISWSPEEVEEARKKMFNGTIRTSQQAFAILPAQLNQPNKTTQPLIHTVPCQVLGQTSLVLTPVANGSTVTCAPLALTVANQVVQAVKRPLPAAVVAPEVKRPAIIQAVQGSPKSMSPTCSFSLDDEKTPDQITILEASFNQSQFPNEDEIYRLIETTGLSRGEIKKWFSDQRSRNHRDALRLHNDLPADTQQKSVPSQFPLLERVKGKTSEQLKMLEESFQKNSFPTQAEVEHLVTGTKLSKTEIESWFSERRALRDNLEQALLNSMGSKKVDSEGHRVQRGMTNGEQEQDSYSRLSPHNFVTSNSVPINGQSLGLLRDVFKKTQWPSPEEYNQLEVQTGLVRTEIVRWFKESRSALKNGCLEWMEQFCNPDSQILAPDKEDVRVLAEQENLNSLELFNRFPNKVAQKRALDGEIREGPGSWAPGTTEIDGKSMELMDKELLLDTNAVLVENSGRLTG